MKAWKVCLYLTMMLIVLTACNSKDQPVEDGLVLYTTYSLGGEDLKVTEVSYSVNLSNRTNHAIYLLSIEPVISESLYPQLIDTELKMNANQEILPMSAKEIKGEFKVDTAGLDKEQIADLIQLKQFKVITEQIVGGENH
ncbi:hypothetical protein [Paenibacillus macerans]|uniref:hypothetical protein n=1 Tax=Paenibacillus macerans TaxID=44252 RepID=UPI003D311231